MEVRLADGLAAFEPADSISCITIAGMGGRLIADILAAGLEKLAGVSRLVLQPNNREDELRAWLVDHDFRIVQEAILEENEKFYEILVVEQGSQELSAKELAFWSLFDAGTSSSICPEVVQGSGEISLCLGAGPS